LESKLRLPARGAIERFDFPDRISGWAFLDDQYTVQPVARIDAELRGIVIASGLPLLPRRDITRDPAVPVTFSLTCTKSFRAHDILNGDLTVKVYDDAGRSKVLQIWDAALKQVQRHAAESSTAAKDPNAAAVILQALPGQDHAAAPEADGEKIFSYCDPRDMPPTGLDDVPPPLGAYIEPPGNERRFLRYPPMFIDDPASTGIFDTMPAEIYAYPPNFVVTAADATLIGNRTILSQGHFFCDESQKHRLATYLDTLARPEPFYNEETGLKRAARSDIFMLKEASRATRSIAGSAVAITSNEPSNYGSFLFRILPKMHILRQTGLLNLPIIVWNGTSSYTELLTLAGADASAIIHHDTRGRLHADRLIVPSMRNPSAYLDPETRALFRHMVDRFGEPRQPGRRLYVSRLLNGNSVSSHRQMLNEVALIDRLRADGVQIFEPLGKSAQAQIKAFSSADMVIGPSGAGMFNTVFCHPGTKVIDIESEPHWIYAHAGLFASCDLPYGIFVGQVDPTDERAAHKRWAVDIDSLINRMKEFS
jgi:capsular polysaccharide biosynthesis protein